MAVIAKNYLDYTGLQAYDTLIKTYVDAGDAKAIKTVLWDETNEQIKFYKKENATLADTADYTVTISSSDVEALKTRVGMTSTLNAYESQTNLTDIMNVLTGNSSTTGSVAKALADAESYTDSAIADLDVAEFALATENNGVVTIKGIKENDGEIAVGTDTTKDVTFAKAATTGAAEDISVADTAGKIDATNVEAAIAELADKAGAQKVYMTDNGATSDYAKVYSIYQGNGSSASPVAGEKIGDINIPKDKVVESGSVVTITFDSSTGKLYDGSTDVTDLIVGTGGTATAADAGKYIKLVLQNVTDPLYIAAKALVDIYNGGTTAEATVTIDNNNVITVTINEIAASKITYNTTSNVGAELDKIEGDAQTAGSIAKAEADAKAYADGLVAGLDTTNDVGISSYDSTNNVITIKNGITETNGVVANNSGDDITLTGITTAQINALFTTP